MSFPPFPWTSEVKRAMDVDVTWMLQNLPKKKMQSKPIPSHGTGFMYLDFVAVEVFMSVNVGI